MTLQLDDTDNSGEQKRSEMHKFLSGYGVSADTIQQLVKIGLDTMDYMYSIGENDVDDLCNECGIKVIQKIKLRAALKKLKQLDMQQNICPVLADEKETICNATDDIVEERKELRIGKDNNKNHMEVAKISCLDITCSCNFKLGEKKLYFCSKCNSDTIYCNDCGDFLHRRAAGMDHEWNDDIVEVPLINSTNYKNGEKQIINLIGAERYKNIIAPRVRALVTQSFTVNNAVILGNSAGMISASYNLGIASSNAISAAKKASTLTTIAANAATKATEAVEHAQAMREQYTVAWSQNPYYWLYNWWYKDDADKARNIYNQAVAARDIAKRKAAECAKAAKSAKHLSDVKTAKAARAATVSQESMTLKLKSSACFTVGLTGIEMFIHAYNYANKEISAYEFWRLSGKSLARNTASAIGSSVGAQIGFFTANGLGAEFGNSICPGFGAIVGSGVGLIGGMVLSWKLGKTAENMYEKIFPSKDENLRKKLICEALLYFRLTEQDIDNPQVFNEKRIKKEYRNAALIAHPDRNNGDHTKWNILSTYYGIVMGLLEQNNKNKKIVKNIVAQCLPSTPK